MALALLVGCRDEAGPRLVTDDPGGTAYVCYDDYSLCLVQDGKDPVRLPTADLQIESFGWSPSGDEIVVATIGAWEVEGTPFVGGDDLYRLDLDGGEAEQLTAGAGHDDDPAWSPDGRYIAFSSDRDLPQTSETAGEKGSLYLLDVQDLSIRRLTDGEDDGEPAWSPDGAEIAFIRDTDVWIVTVTEAARPRRLPVTTPRVATSVAWAPDGERLAIGDFMGGIFIARVDGNESDRLPIRPATVEQADEPAWSPDGSRLAFSGLDAREECPAIFAVSADGGPARQLTFCGSGYVLADAPAWRPR